MTFKEALDYFQNLVSQTRNKSEIKVFKEFIRILTRLEERDLSAFEMKTIESELKRLHLGTTIFVLTFALLMSIFSKSIHRRDVKIIYGGIMNKLEASLAEMEELRD